VNTVVQRWQDQAIAKIVHVAVRRNGHKSGEETAQASDNAISPTEQMDSALPANQETRR
jgi:hypothetical protein